MPMGWLGAALSAVLVTIGCAGPVRYTRPIQDSGTQYVQLEARYGYGTAHDYDSAALRFNHPLSLSERDWGRILTHIQVQPQKRLLTIGQARNGPRLAFNEIERNYLASHLAPAFLTARRDEWVVFYLSQPRGMQVESAVTEVTSGGLFVTDSQLHLLLANYRYVVSMDSVLDQIREDPLRPAGDGFYEFVPGPHQTARPVKIWDLTQPLRAYNLELALDYQAILSSPVEADLSPQSTMSLEERLERLQRLYEKGLVTEEEYRLKRQSLMDEL